MLGCGLVSFFRLASSLPYLCQLVVIVLAPLAFLLLFVSRLRFVATRSVPRCDNQPLTDICCFLCYRILLASLLLAGLDFGCLGVGCGVVRFFCLESSLPYLCRLDVIVLVPLASFPFDLCLKTLIWLLVSRKCCIAFFLRFGHLIRAQF